jgi:NADH-quinone oxidoreductase subunit L
VPSLETLGSFTWLIPALTLAAFVIIVAQVGAGRGGRSAGLLAVGAIAAGAVLALALLAAALAAGGEELAHHPVLTEPRLVWAVFATDTITFGWLLDPLSVATVAMVTVVCTMIFIYATGYMRGEVEAYRNPTTGEVDTGTGWARYARFFAYVSLFATGMLGFVLSSNLLQAIVFWEIMGLCSFLLIGFWYHKPSAAAAAKKAFLTTRVGDMLLLVGAFYLYWVFGTLDYERIVTPEAVDTLVALGSTPVLGVGWVTVIALLLFGGAVGKSAQFPLHVWLPDAMEGPTPVSALIHAATMVAAGVFLVARLFPIFEAGHEAISPAMTVVAVVGAFTALFAATIAVAQFDIKRVLAYSTVSQLGYMVMALGLGAWLAAVFHLLTHAFFKALLFLGSGSVIHGVEHGMHHDQEHGHSDQDEHPSRAGEDPHDPQDMRNMGGLRNRMPITFWTFLIGTLALTGVPLFSGFWSKDEILAEAFHLGMHEGLPVAGFVWLCGTIAAFFTAFYMARQIFMVFTGAPRTEGARHAPESGPAMVYPLVVLAVFALVAGFVGVHEGFPLLGPMLGNPLHHFAGHLSFGYKEIAAIPFDFAPMLVSVAAAGAGWILGWLLYGRARATSPSRDPLQRLGPVWRLLHNKYYVDELYGHTIVPLTKGFATLNALVDARLIDGVVNAVGRGGRVFGDANGWFDRHVVDGAVNLAGITTQEMARGLRWLQTGRVQQYALVLFVSVLVLLGVFAF